MSFSERIPTWPKYNIHVPDGASWYLVSVNEFLRGHYNPSKLWIMSDEWLMGRSPKVAFYPIVNRQS